MLNETPFQWGMAPRSCVTVRNPNPNSPLPAGKQKSSSIPLLAQPLWLGSLGMGEQRTDGSYLLFSELFAGGFYDWVGRCRNFNLRTPKYFAEVRGQQLPHFSKMAAEALEENYALLWVSCREGKGALAPRASARPLLPRGMRSMRLSTFHPGRDALSSAPHQKTKEKPPTPGAEEILDLQKPDSHLGGLGSQ